MYMNNLPKKGEPANLGWCGNQCGKWLLGVGACRHMAGNFCLGGFINIPHTCHLNQAVSHCHQVEWGTTTSVLSRRICETSQVTLIMAGDIQTPEPPMASCAPVCVWVYGVQLVDNVVGRFWLCALPARWNGRRAQSARLSAVHGPGAVDPPAVQRESWPVVSRRYSLWSVFAVVSASYVQDWVDWGVRVLCPIGHKDRSFWIHSSQPIFWLSTEACIDDDSSLSSLVLCYWWFFWST